jgi:hypothetical protein
MYKNFTNKYGERIYNPEAYMKEGGTLYSDEKTFNYFGNI